MKCFAIIDITLAEHLPMFGGFIGAGANGFSYKQSTGDSNPRARLGGRSEMAAETG
jgi:hypothetical protein